MPEPLNSSDVAAAIQATRESYVPLTYDAGTLGGVPLIVLHKDQKVEHLKPYIDANRTAPIRRTGTSSHATLDSFVAHVKAFGGDTTVIFASPISYDTNEGPFIQAVYDYHPAGGDQTKAAYGEYRARYPLILSSELAAWKGNAEKQLDPMDFARFIEDRLLDVVAVDPTAGDYAALRSFAAALNTTFADPSQLLNLSRSLSISADIGVRQAITLQTGEISIAYTEVHRDGGGGEPIRVPGLFAIGIPVFEQGQRYRLPVRLRYRLLSQQVKWWYQIVNVNAAIADATKDAIAKVGVETGRAVFVGRPEK